MPIYAYKCADCGHEKEVLQKISDAPLTDCPSCGHPSMAKMVTAAGFQVEGQRLVRDRFPQQGLGRQGRQAGWQDRERQRRQGRQRRDVDRDPRRQRARVRQRRLRLLQLKLSSHPGAAGSPVSACGRSEALIPGRAARRAAQ